MKKTPKNQRNTKAAIVATLLTAPMLATPAVTYGQRGETAPTEKSAKVTKGSNAYFKFGHIDQKTGSDLTIIGVGDGRTIYEKPNGDKFYIDTETGDMKAVSDKYWIKWRDAGTDSKRSSNYLKIKMNEAFKIVGVDADGNVIHEKPNGDRFKVHTNTGHVTLIK